MRWLLTYADMITLLNVFFIVLYSVAKIDLERATRVRESLARAFNVGVMRGQESRGAVLGQGGAVSPPLLSLYRHIAADLGPFAAQLHAEEAMSVGLRRDAVVIRLSAGLLFPSGRATLSPEGEAVLRRLAPLLRAAPGEIHVAGHTDAIPFSSSQYADNWALSLARAATVLRFLRDDGQIPATRFSLAAYADTHPVAENDTREGRAQNRRVEIIVRAALPGGDRGGPCVSPCDRMEDNTQERRRSLQVSRVAGSSR
jgi:chemotaxis protein MotB